MIATKVEWHSRHYHSLALSVKKVKLEGKSYTALTMDRHNVRHGGLSYQKYDDDRSGVPQLAGAIDRSRGLVRVNSPFDQVTMFVMSSYSSTIIGKTSLLCIHQGCQRKDGKSTSAPTTPALKRWTCIRRCHPGTWRYSRRVVSAFVTAHPTQLSTMRLRKWTS